MRIQSGLNYIATQQQADGSFLSFSSQAEHNFADTKTYHSTFPASLMLSSLQALPSQPKVDQIREKLAFFLLAQKSDHWTFNYWARDALENKEMPYPDDLDDTACALAALTLHDPTLVDGTALANTVTVLTMVEEKEGGPYRTWLVPPGAGSEWQDVDLAVNSNIAYFLSLHEVSLPHVTAFMETAILQNAFKSPYYPSLYPLIYFIARAYKGPQTKRLREFLLSERLASGDWGTPLRTALAMSSLINLKVNFKELAHGVEYLQKQQQADGSWAPEAFCLDPAVKGTTYYAGSSALTTTFCLEALTRHQSAAPRSRSTLSQKTSVSDKIADRLYASVIEVARTRCDACPDDLRDLALTALEATLKQDKDRQIVLLPYRFKEALGENGQQVDLKLIETLGLASLYGWMAYTIYDDFLDEEGTPSLLPVATVCLRELTHLFGSISPVKSGFDALFHKTMDELDAANAWEVINCHLDPDDLFTAALPDYGDLSQLANRSIGHALGPMAILFSLGYDDTSGEVQTLQTFFRHYLIARQLSDDAHDWEEDLKRGHVNAVGASLLNHIRRSKNPKTSPDDLRLVFWHEVITGVCDQIQYHVKEAEDALKSLDIVSDEKVLRVLLKPSERAAKKALHERNETLKFLKAYETQG